MKSSPFISKLTHTIHFWNSGLLAGPFGLKPFVLSLEVASESYGFDDSLFGTKTSAKYSTDVEVSSGPMFRQRARMHTHLYTLTAIPYFPNNVSDEGFHGEYTYGSLESFGDVKQLRSNNSTASHCAICITLCRLIADNQEPNRGRSQFQFETYLVETTHIFLKQSCIPRTNNNLIFVLLY